MRDAQAPVITPPQGADLHAEHDSTPGPKPGGRTDERLELILSPTLLAEITSVLSRPRLRRYVSEPDAARFVDDLAALASGTPDAPKPHPAICRDPNDDYLIALARSSGAEAIVTGDRDLLDLEDLRPPVITPRDLVARLDS